MSPCSIVASRWVCNNPLHLIAANLDGIFNATVKLSASSRPTWSKAMVEARGQAERYAKALPIDHGWPSFLLVTDVGHCIDVYADFSGTLKQYTQFPDAARFRIALDDLRDEDVRTRLANIWTDPLSLDPSKEAARVTREIAEHLAELSKRLEKREQNPTRVADFLICHPSGYAGSSPAVRITY
ncbi:MAG: type IIL restriction-modification enzyme MmeI [Sphingorhabdus sp.]